MRPPHAWITIGLALALAGCANNHVFCVNYGIACATSDRGADPCSARRPDGTVDLPLDNRWVSGTLDCPGGGDAAIAFLPKTRSDQLVLIQIEVVGEDRPITLTHDDGQGFPAPIIESQMLGQVRIGIGATPSSVVTVSSREPVEFRLRAIPQSKARRSRRPVEPLPPPPPEPAPPAPEAPEVIADPPPPDTQLATIVDVDGDPARGLQLALAAPARIGQPGRLLRDGEVLSTLCIDRLDAGRTFARLDTPLAASALQGEPAPRIEISTLDQVPADLVRSSGSPVFRIELRQGGSSCLYEGLRGALIAEEGPVATFELTRVVRGRSWGELDSTVEKATAESARIVLYLDPASRPE